MQFLSWSTFLRRRFAQRNERSGNISAANQREKRELLIVHGDVVDHPMTAISCWKFVLRVASPAQQLWNRSDEASGRVCRSFSVNHTHPFPPSFVYAHQHPL